MHFPQKPLYMNTRTLNKQKAKNNKEKKKWKYIEKFLIYSYRLSSSTNTVCAACQPVCPSICRPLSVFINTTTEQNGKIDVFILKNYMTWL